MQLDKSMKQGAMERTTLVFPATHPDGLKYLEAARERGENVVAATSESRAALPEGSGELVVLPYVHEAVFPERFIGLIRQHSITRVYVPVAAVYSWLNRFIAEQNLAVRLVGESPIKREVGRFNQLIGKVGSYRRFIDECAGGSSDLGDLEIASVLRMADHIYGESNEHKIAAMMAIFSSVPKGDVIEIGALVGKSAAVLAFLARRYDVGNVLAVDPWQSSSATQYDSPPAIQVDAVGEWNYEILPQDFIVNMLPVGLGCFNYLRQDSKQGFESFRRDRAVASKVFGKVDYRGKIAIIHIDGNHDYANVKQDCELWLPLMVPNGWLILDDYQWAHGDGVLRVGDGLLEQCAQDIERAFVCGKALFVKFGVKGVSGPSSFTLE